MNDIERQVERTLHEGLDGLEMPDRLPAIRKRARRARFVSFAAAAVVLVGAVFAGATILDAFDKPEVADPRPRPALSPLTPVVSAEIRFRGAGAFDLDAGSGAIWVAAHEGREAFETRLLEIDPVRNRAEETGVDLGAFSWGEVEVSGDTVWVKSDHLVSVDARTHNVLTTTRVPGDGLAVGHGSVWTVDARIDSSTGRVEAQIPETRGDEIVSDNRWLWTADWSGRAQVDKIDPETTSVAATSSRAGFDVEDVTSDGADAWVAWGLKTDDGPVEITELSGASDEAIGDVIRIPKTRIVTDMTFAAGRLWVVANDIDGRASLYQVDPTSHTLIGDPLPLEGTLVRLTPFRNSLWVSDYDRNTITRIDLLSCSGGGCEPKDDAEKAREAESQKERNECATAIEGAGLEPGEPVPPRPYFEPFNSWQTPIGNRCLVVLAGRQRKWDKANVSEGGSRKRGAVLVWELTKEGSVLDMERFYAPLRSPIRIVDFRGRGRQAELFLQSLDDCSVASFDLATRTFESEDVVYECPRTKT